MRNPVSLLELSVQLRSIWLLEMAAAVRLLGAIGGLDADAELLMNEATEGTPLEFTMNNM